MSNVVKNKLEKSFGSAGTTAGSIIFGVGLFCCFTSFGIVSVLLLLIGAFVGFSSTFVLIDFDKKRIKFTNRLFGFIDSGKWLNIEDSMKLGIRKSNTGWQIYSRGNRMTSYEDKDLRICLIDSSDKEIMEIKKTKTMEDAEYQLNLLAKQLGIDITTHFKSQK